MGGEGADVVDEVFRQVRARAVLALSGAGLATGAQANARACCEHAILLQRLALAVA